MKPCGNPECATSTGIHGGATHGWGDLDHNGFWEHECEPCTRAERQREDPPTRHDVSWFGVFRGTDTDPREVGWCLTCDREVYDRDAPDHDQRATDTKGQP